MTGQIWTRQITKRMNDDALMKDMWDRYVAGDIVIEREFTDYLRDYLTPMDIIERCVKNQWGYSDFFEYWAQEVIDRAPELLEKFGYKREESE